MRPVIAALTLIPMFVLPAQAKHYRHYHRHHAPAQKILGQMPAYAYNNDGRVTYSGTIEANRQFQIEKPRTNRTYRTVRRTHYKPQDANGNTALRGAGNVVSHKTGATARVSPQYAAKFQSYIDDLEAAGAKILFMGGIRAGRCWSGGMHPCGKALDVCQRSRGVVDPRCHLPGPSQMASIAANHGLFEGGQWCNSDYGHAQAGVSAPACGGSTSAARSHRRHYYASRHYGVRHYALR